MSVILFGIVGSGWRAEFFLRVARSMPEKFSVTGVTSRNAEKRSRLEKQWGVRAFASAQELLDQKNAMFVATAVPGAVNPEVIAACAGAGMPVLSETPPAPDEKGLQALDRLAAKGLKIQVAEQYHLQPHHAACLELAAQEKLGSISQVQVSVAHGYHGISLMRRLLGIGFEPCTITARVFRSPIVAGPDRRGPPRERRIKDSVQQLAWFDFGDRMGVFDFTGDQYFSWIRNARLLVRGERGEIVNRQVTYLKDFQTPIRLDFVRHQGGVDGNLEANCLRGIQLGDEWLYVNPCIPAALTDDEIAVASCLFRMADYVETGREFYSLAEASQDHYLFLKMQEAIETGTAIRAETCWNAKT